MRISDWSSDVCSSDLAKQAFKRMVTANHETNALAVANKQVDVATNNTESLERLRQAHPEKADLIKVVWKSPLIPADPIVWRKNLPDADKETQIGRAHV